MFFIKNAKEQIVKNKDKIIKKDVKKLKKLVIKDIKYSIKNGYNISTTSVSQVNRVFEIEISDKCIQELTQEYPEIGFTFCYGYDGFFYVKHIKAIIIKEE